MAGDGCYYILEACSVNNPLQNFKLNKDEESKLTEVSCEEVISSLWQDFTFDGDYNKARCHVWCNMFKRCDIHDKVVSLYVEDNLLKLDFNGTILTKETTSPSN